jgi:hypothetical protein
VYTFSAPLAGSRLPYTPFCPVNQSMPSPSNAAVLRLAFGTLTGYTVTWSLASIRTSAFSPPSVTHAAPSGPVITPCGADPAPSGISRTSPLAGSSQPRRPVACAVYQTPPSAAGATSCGWLPAGTG